MNRLVPSSWWRGRVPQEPSQAQDPFFSLHREIDRLFDDFARLSPFSAMRFSDNGLMPSIDVSETDNELRVEADLPGLDEKDVEVVLSDQTLTIKGEKKSQREETKKDYRLVERSAGSFHRSIALPFAADAGSVSADFSKGVLTVTIPKPREAQSKAHKISIKKSQ